MLFAIFLIVFAAILIVLLLRAKNRVFRSIVDSGLDEELGQEPLPGDEGMDMVQVVGNRAIDLTMIVLGGTGLTDDQIVMLHLGYHLLVDFKCQLCGKVMPEYPERCTPRIKEPPPLPEIECDYCLGDGCEECGPVGR